MSKELCSKHAQHAAAQARARKIADLPGERWKNIDEHPKWMVSTMGRVKSLRGCNERLITPRVENGRLFIEDGIESPKSADYIFTDLGTGPTMLRMSAKYP